MIKKFKEFRSSTIPEPDLSISINEKDEITDEDKPVSSRSKKSSKHKWYQGPYTKKEKLIAAGVAVGLLIIILGVILYIHHHHKKPVVKPVVSAVKAPPPAPVIHSPLTGLPVTLAQSQLPITGVMIENSDLARPQSGLSQAGVVFEAIAEAGITRFLALFEEGQPTSIGPIRSARPYYIDWLLGFDASYAHVGGSPIALNNIKAYGVKDLDEFYNGGSYVRISQRAAPHNVYTSMANLLALEQSKGYATSKFVGFPRKPEAPSKTPTATKIDFNISSSDYAVHYDYSATTNSYNRSEGGSPMVDSNTGQQLSPKTVIAIVAPEHLDADGYHSDYSDIGSGQAYIFQDGTVTVGTWSKSSQTSQIQFGTTAGDPIALNDGQAWITAVGLSSMVSYH